MVTVPANGNTFEYTYGGPQEKGAPIKSIPPKSTNSEYVFLGGFDSQGVPDYLEPNNDVIEQSLLTDINNSLLPGRHIESHHPEYVDPDNQHNLSLLDPAEVWVTFVHEGAGYRNTLGFYTYETGNAPASPDDIDAITIIFPNTSYKYSGGGLHSGNKVKIGEFAGNTTIGWVLISNAWQNGTVGNGYNKLYSDPNLNPEPNPDLKQHSVFLNDLGRDLILLGFEDIRRDNQGPDPYWCDHDFEDVVYYITVSPQTSVDMANLPNIDYTGDDSDGDGVPNNFDDYPNDASQAFNNYFFTEGTYGSLAYEDMWPGTGDYDFNDLVVNYNFNQITNADNDVVEIIGEFNIMAFGASFHNGFGIDFGISPSLISSVTGYDVQANWADINSKGLENGQTNAVVILFDDTYRFMEHTGGIGVNTNPTFTYVQPHTFNLNITLTEPVPIADIGVPPYNPFLIVNQERSHEIHLVDHAPTDLANTALFGTMRDDSDPGSNRYYKTENNLPWAMKLIEPFEYPIEKVEILNAYLKFGQWAESSGQTYTDWYLDESGYRNDGNIYPIPE